MEHSADCPVQGRVINGPISEYDYLPHFAFPPCTTNVLVYYIIRASLSLSPHIACNRLRSHPFPTQDGAAKGRFSLHTYRKPAQAALANYSTTTHALPCERALKTVACSELCWKGCFFLSLSLRLWGLRRWRRWVTTDRGDSGPDAGEEWRGVYCARAWSDRRSGRDTCECRSLVSILTQNSHNWSNY